MLEDERWIEVSLLPNINSRKKGMLYARIYSIKYLNINAVSLHGRIFRFTESLFSGIYQRVYCNTFAPSYEEILDSFK
jgi:HKD family nuclease